MPVTRPQIWFGLLLITSLPVWSATTSVGSPAVSSSTRSGQMSGVMAIHSPTTGHHNTLTAPKEPPKEQALAPSAFSTTMELNYNSNMYEASAPERSESLDFLLLPFYRITRDLGLSAVLSGAQDLRGEQPSRFDNTTVSLSYKEIDGNRFGTKTTLGGVLPTNRESHINQTYNGAVVIGQGIVLKANDWILPTNFSIAESIKRNFHEYDTDIKGVSNTQYSLRTTTDLSVDLTKSWNLDIYSYYDIGQSYLGVQKTKFLTDVSLCYAWTQHFSLKAGFSNNGDAQTADRRDLNMRFFNEESSEVHVGTVIHY